MLLLIRAAIQTATSKVNRLPDVRAPAETVLDFVDNFGHSGLCNILSIHQSVLRCDRSAYTGNGLINLGVGKSFVLSVFSRNHIITSPISLVLGRSNKLLPLMHDYWQYAIHGSSSFSYIMIRTTFCVPGSRNEFATGTSENIATLYL
ncbi:uncharacterized protein LAJ45_07677 [Morchella importuna]|uniref:uncharacterized protein n=1 Tax=Morchella importuna TaxID=1174673 RepID=UPI001E8E60E3|nr:uncharacterized protein LAJ45_07677 [Morchella importuna]KAH8148225.1 hypothetical protein LAJ45_07677 [Morchella importuna]